MRAAKIQSSVAAVALGACYQLEEVMSLWLMYRMSYVPFMYLVKKEDASENDIYFLRTLQVGVSLGLLLMVPPLAGESTR